MSKHVDADALLAALYEADAITPRGAEIIREFPEDMASKKLLAASADPKKAQRLFELSEADADGRAEIFPCHIGGTLFTVKDGRVFETPIIGYHSYEWQQGFRMRLLFDARLTNGCFDYPISDYGKTVFLTREEAEAALKGGRKADET